MKICVIQSSETLMEDDFRFCYDLINLNTHFSVILDKTSYASAVTKDISLLQIQMNVYLFNTFCTVVTNIVLLLKVGFLIIA